MRLFPRENYLKKIRACSGGHDHHGRPVHRGVRIPALHSVVGWFCAIVDIVYVEQLLEPCRGAFLSRGFVDSHGFPFHSLVLRARRA
mgnify:FL=1